MKKVFENPQWAKEIGENARLTITKELSRERVGQLIKDRLGSLILNQHPANNLVSLRNLYGPNAFKKELLTVSNYFIKPARKRVQKICYRKLRSILHRLKARFVS